MGSSNEEVILEIQTTLVKCKKSDLTSNSDYFKAMFEGNFIEKSQSKIKLEGVDLKAMNIILCIIWDDSFIIAEEDILSVLQTACMLQFIEIRNKCLTVITGILCPNNCIKIWCVTEKLDLKPLSLKAKTMCLEEFVRIKDMDCILEFSLEEICHYLGHINLKTDNELSVFYTVMRWWHENAELHVDNSTNVLLKLLSCIDFENLLDSYLMEMMKYADITNNTEIRQILSCVSLLKSDKSVENLPETVQERARLLIKSRGRMSPRSPCLLVNLVRSEEQVNKEEQHKIIHYDKFRRKRRYSLLENGRCRTDAFSVIYFDKTINKFKVFFDIDKSLISSLSGFKVIGYKELIFMFGGEYLIGKGNWNYDFWVYDTIRETWKTKCALPYPRRHFEACMVDEILYIVEVQDFIVLFKKTWFGTISRRIYGVVKCFNYPVLVDNLSVVVLWKNFLC